MQTAPNTNTRATLLRQRSQHLLELARIDAELADLESAAPTTDPASVIYTTARGGPLPPCRSRRWLRDHARQIPGATRAGGARGRDVVWSVSARDYRVWLETRALTTTQPARAPAPVVAIDEWISASGYRASRGAR